MAFESPWDGDIEHWPCSPHLCIALIIVQLRGISVTYPIKKKLALKFKGNKQLHQICKQMSDNYSKRQTIAFELCFLSWCTNRSNVRPNPWIWKSLLYENLATNVSTFREVVLMQQLFVAGEIPHSVFPLKKRNLCRPLTIQIQLWETRFVLHCTLGPPAPVDCHAAVTWPLRCNGWQAGWAVGPHKKWRHNTFCIGQWLVCRTFFWPE